jgi:hypothetical protein
MATSGGYGLGGFTGGGDPSSTPGQGGGSSPLDMQGFLGMLMQFLRRYSQGGGSMQPGQFPPAPLESLGETPQRARAYSQGFDYTQRRPAYQIEPARSQGLSPQRPSLEPLNEMGIAPLRAPAPSSGPGMTREAVV